MRIQSRWTLRAVSLGLSLILAGGELVSAVGQTQAPQVSPPPQASPAQQEETQAQPPQSQPAEAAPAPLPDAPSSSPANQPSAVGQSSGDQGNAQPNGSEPNGSEPNGTEPKTVQPQNGQTPNNDQNPPQQSKPQEPAGTAAAQAAQTSGGAASKPAGMAIAPAKQRQVRVGMNQRLDVANGEVAQHGAIFYADGGRPSCGGIRTKHETVTGAIARFRGRCGTSRAVPRAARVILVRVGLRRSARVRR